MPDLRFLLGGSGKKGKGKFGGRGGRRGNTSSHTPHQGMQERLRRAVGGWAWQRRMSGLTKRQALAEAKRALTFKGKERALRAATELGVA
jgi:hypothetical protein